MLGIWEELGTTKFAQFFASGKCLCKCKCHNTTIHSASDLDQSARNANRLGSLICEKNNNRCLSDVGDVPTPAAGLSALTQLRHLVSSCKLHLRIGDKGSFFPSFLTSFPSLMAYVACSVCLRVYMGVCHVRVLCQNQ